MKPHKGTINNWKKVPIDTDKVRKFYNEDPGLGYIIAGTVDNHPDFGRSNYFTSSWVVKREGNDIETRNSRYKLGTQATYGMDDG